MAGASAQGVRTELRPCRPNRLHLSSRVHCQLIGRSACDHGTPISPAAGENCSAEEPRSGAEMAALIFSTASGRLGVGVHRSFDRPLADPAA